MCANANKTQGEEPMSLKHTLLLASLFAAATCSGTASAQIATIPVPGDNPLNSYDISYVDQASQRLFLADRTNKSIDIFDAKNDKYIGRVGGMTGLMFK